MNVHYMSTRSHRKRPAASAGDLNSTSARYKHTTTAPHTPLKPFPIKRRGGALSPPIRTRKLALLLGGILISTATFDGSRSCSAVFAVASAFALALAPALAFALLLLMLPLLLLLLL